MNKTVGAIVGAAIGIAALGSVGFSFGYLFLWWFGPKDCCGLEGLYPLVLGSLTGALLGMFCGGLAGVIVAGRRPLKLMRLVVLVFAGVTVAWLASLVVGRFIAENTLLILVFLAVTLFIPAIVWITDVWEKPDTSI